MRKPLKVAAYSLLIVLSLSFVVGFFGGAMFSVFPVSSFSGALIGISIFYNLVSSILVLISAYGFVVLGRKLKNEFLVNMSWIGMVLFLIYVIYIFFGGLFVNIPAIPTQADLTALSNSSQDGLDPVQSFVKFLLLTHVVYSVIFGLFMIFFGIAILKVKKKMKYAKPTGILNIFLGATLFIFVGYLVSIPTLIMEILLLFEASKKFEKS